jgi:hypothetical protein
VGYNSINIYQIWNPVTGQTLAMRDVIFKEDEGYSSNPKDLKDDIVRPFASTYGLLVVTVQLLPL